MGINPVWIVVSASSNISPRTALNHGRNGDATGMGAEGIDGLRNGEHCLLADTPAAFADAVLQLLGDPVLGRRLGSAGRALVAERYDWSTIVPRLEALLDDLMR